MVRGEEASSPMVTMSSATIRLLRLRFAASSTSSSQGTIRATLPRASIGISTAAVTLVLEIVSRRSGTADLETSAQSYLNQFATVEAPLSDGRWIPAATVTCGCTLNPYVQCLISRTVCEPLRPSLGASILPLAAAIQISEFAVGVGQ